MNDRTSAEYLQAEKYSQRMRRRGAARIEHIEGYLAGLHAGRAEREALADATGPVKEIRDRWASLDAFLFAKRYPDSWIDHAKKDIANLIAWLQTEREQHAAWRKRAEESEALEIEREALIEVIGELYDFAQGRCETNEDELELADLKKRFASRLARHATESPGMEDMTDGC